MAKYSNRAGYAQTLCLVLAIGTAAGCSDSALTGDVEVEILAVTGSDADDNSTSFALQTRTLRGVTDLDSLKTEQLRVVRGGVLVVDEIESGDVVEESTFKNGMDADLRYRKEDGVVVPRDYQSLAMLSALYHMQETALALDTLGVDGDAFFADGNFEVLFEPEFRTVQDGVSIQVRPKLNAFYLPGARQFGLAQRSGIEAVPISSNGAVLGHEFGHALFEFLFFDRTVPSSCESNPAEGRLLYEYAISGFNEGYGDFMAFTRFGVTNPLFGFSNILDLSGREFSSTFLFSELEGDSACRGKFYCIGTLFARSLFAAYVDLGFDPANTTQRAQFATEVNAALDGTRQRILSGGLLPEATVFPCSQRSAISLSRDGQVAGAFLSALVAGLPAGTRSSVCTQLIANFGVEGFPDSARGACAP